MRPGCPGARRPADIDGATYAASDDEASWLCCVTFSHSRFQEVVRV